MHSIYRKKVLVAPLNWGLGHATRCIPIIRQLCDAGLEVHIGSDGAALILLKKEFPQLTIHHLAPLHITYGKNFNWHLFRQSFRFIQSIKEDQKRTRALSSIQPFDYIISDNRYGVHYPGSYNVLLTHQLQIFRPRWLRPLSRLMIRRLTASYQACWIPDFSADYQLTGLLSGPRLNIPKVFIGILSRLIRKQVPIHYEWAIVLSGPEPNRTALENKILNQFSKIVKPPKSILIRGLPITENILSSRHSALTILNFADSTQLNDIVNASRFVICRSGYTSIMDMITMIKPAILIPTSGQTEQEYLAHRLKGNPLFLCVPESEFDLNQVFSETPREVSQVTYNSTAVSIFDALPNFGVDDVD